MELCKGIVNTTVRANKPQWAVRVDNQMGTQRAQSINLINVFSDGENFQSSIYRKNNEEAGQTRVAMETCTTEST